MIRNANYTLSQALVQKPFEFSPDLDVESSEEEE